MPISLLVLALAPSLLRESKDPNATGNVDLVGVPIGTIGVGLVMFAIVQAGSWGLTDPRVVAAFLVGLSMFPILIRRSRHQPEPLLELDLFRLRSFSSTNAGLALYSTAFTSGFLVNSLLLQEMWGESLRATGLALVAAPLLSAITSPIAGRFADRVGHRWILAAGSASCAVGYLTYLFVLDENPATWSVFVPVSLFVGLGVGATIATWSSAGLADVSPAKFGTANATVRTTQQVFYALGISIVIVLLADVSIDPRIDQFRWAWAFVGVGYLTAAVVVAVTFPSGSSDDRAAAGTTRSA